MKKQIVLMKLFWGLGAFLLAAMPTIASAHDGVGDDELAVANWMLVGAIVTIVLGVFMGLWAARSGQFNNVEESKYKMLEHAEDYDAIMEEADARDTALREAEALRATQLAHSGMKAATVTSSTERAAKASRI